METSSFFGKLVTSNDVLLGHTGKRYIGKKVKGCFPEADTGKRMLDEGIQI